MTATLEHLLAREVEATEARKLAGRLRFASLPTPATLADFDFDAAPGIRKPHLLSLAAGDDWIESGGNLLLFGQSGTGKTHAVAAIGHALIDTGRRVLFCSTTDMVQKLQSARRDLSLPAMLDKLDKFDLIVLDDLSYVRKDQVETSALFELIAPRYERHSLAITANQPFSAWDNVFPDPAMTVAAIDRLEVSNGAGTSRLAARTAQRLSRMGAAVTHVTNYRSFGHQRTEIHYREGHAEDAKRLGERLPVDAKLVSVGQLRAGVDIRLVLGRDMAADEVAAWWEATPEVARSDGANGWRHL